LRCTFLHGHLYGQDAEMGAVNLADAKVHLSELVDRIEAGIATRRA
jgi:hypothetical protein